MECIMTYKERGAEGKNKSKHDSKPSKGSADKERRFWSSGAKHGSNASLDSAASGGSRQKPSAASKGSKQ